MIALPEGHRFPIAKYALLRDAVLAEGVVAPAALHDPARAPLEDVHRVHDAEYITRLLRGTMPAAEQRALGFPWSEGLVERSFRASGGTLEAALHALDAGIAMNLAGGTHHAFASHGEGFCVLNDVAIAVCALRAQARIRRAAVIDLDVHQGNGTHAIFVGDDDTFTFSMHGRRNYPFRKVAGTLDVELEDGTGDTEYLEKLAEALPQVLAAARPDLVLYLAGADPHEGDTLGRLKLSFDGLMRRDALVLEAARSVGVPVAIAIAGGYGADIRDTVRVHVNTARVAASFL
ncbi:histone deacetylase [Pseudogemmatithrix spongiicola]|uniref:Histone deacetylase n=1 Tax=Pseudogemmatithrix spongiicola TaxID=3062599 RepID=A0AA49JSF4_9BACT|nr:histone deacetylase [Gemmatimonadaceae bacterium 'strain 138']WKW14016.1 histone deacetylase [Gemmatimonadaceae bacterium 'strain 318']